MEDVPTLGAGAGGAGALSAGGASTSAKRPRGVTGPVNTKQ